MRYLMMMLFPLALHSQAPNLKGTAKGHAHDNVVADKDRMSKIRDDSMLERFKDVDILVPLPDGVHGLVVDGRLEKNRRFCRQVAVDFLTMLGDSVEHYFHRPLQVNSCVRDSVTQAELREHNRNAAPVAGPYASLHLRGNTVDIRRFGVSAKVQRFVDAKLAKLKAQCKIGVAKETKQLVWHVVVYKDYRKKGSACAKKGAPRSKKK